MAVFSERSKNCENQLFASYVYLTIRLSVRYPWNNSAPTGRIFMKFDIWVFFENIWRKFEFH